ncbi:CopM family metallochaperone [Sphingomonas montanisoli]|nr:DUF305 domain-containing protein [Sphingomonas montanisoli]
MVRGLACLSSTVSRGRFEGSRNWQRSLLANTLPFCWLGRHLPRMLRLCDVDKKMPLKLILSLAGLSFAASAGALAAAPQDFATDMAAAMERMHHAMMVAPSGDPDRDFAAMMIPHHQGAIEMAEAQLRYGKDERLRRLAQGIIVEQRQEIAVMQAILAEKGAPKNAQHQHQGDGQ